MSDETPRGGMEPGLEAEIAAALGDMSVEDMLDYADRPKRTGDRDTREGTVVRIDREDVMVEFGPKSIGLCPLAHFEERPVTGTRMSFTVERFDKKDGMLVLSRKGAVRKAEWESLEIGQMVEARCTGTNKGGLEMEVANHRAFMPAGHVDIRHIEDLSVFVGEKIPCEVIELDRSRGRIVLSRRSFVEAERARTRDELMGSLKEGATVQGTIVSVRDFGAFVDLGGADGLVHISDMAWERVKDPKDVVTVGDNVTVKILKVDTSQDPPRIGLGMKQCQEDPFEATAATIEVGGDVTGRVTKLTDFGAFVEIAPGTEGLIHISELSHERVNRVSSVVKEGEVVTAKVVSYDAERRRIGLSLKAAKAKELEDTVDRGKDPELRKMMSQLGSKFGGDLRGGLG
ncbi:MAG: 30S ribosomal protein S1 [Phycisphaerales bacterium]